MLWIKDLQKYYKSKKGEEFHALKGINLFLEEKGFVFLLGKSGSGKSTLLNILGGLDTYDCGEIIIKDRHTDDFKSHDWDSFRNTYVGFVFQEFYMVDSFTIGKNIAISLELQGIPKKEIKERVNEILKQVGLEGYANRKPSEISGGQKQRIAIARALVKNPQIILADEPTGNLDSETGKAILNILKELSKDKLVIMVSHDTEFARTYADRIIELKDGIIINDGLSHEQNENAIYEHVDEDIQSLIHIPTGQYFNQQLIQYLAKQAEQNQDGYIILTTTEPNQIASGKLTIQTSEMKDMNEFSPNSKQSNGILELKDSKLPSKSAIKLAFSNILMKKFRFVFINFLFIIALVLLGFATMFSFFDLSNATYSTISNNEVTYMGFRKETVERCINGESDHCYDIPQGISYDEFNELEDAYPSITFTKSRSQATVFTHDYRPEMGYFTNRMEYVTIIEDKDMFPLYRGRYPKQVGEVLISDYVARVMRVFAYGQISIDEILGRLIDTGYNQYTIVGVVNTDSEKFDHLVNSRVMERFEEDNFFQTADIHYKHLYMTQETYDFTFNRVTSQARIGEQELGVRLVQPNDKINSRLIGDSRLPSAVNEIVIPASDAYNFFLSKSLLDYDPNDPDLHGLIGESFDLTFQVFNRSTSYVPGSGDIPSEQFIDLEPINYKIVGIYGDINAYHVIEPLYVWVVTSEEIDKINDLFSPYVGDYVRNFDLGYVKLSDNQNVNKKFIKKLVDDGWFHVTEYSDDLYQMDKLINQYEQALYLVGTIIASFAGLMIFLFITTSIHKKQKEIGILRAIGARGIDVAKIYLFEGLIIALISSLWANGISIGLVYLANYYLAMEMNFKLVLLNYGFFNILLVFGFDINLEMDDKGFVVILGKSGSGKSTLLNILGGLDRYDSGEFIIKDKTTKELKTHEWDSYRNTYVGIVFQEFYIIEEYSVGKNIALALELQGCPSSDIDHRVKNILSQVDLEGHENRKPSEISGGQKQRIAIARALIKDPQIILADEPTGNLDSETGRLVLKTLKKLSKDKLVIMVTHDHEMARTYADRIIEIKDGEIVRDDLNEAQSLDQIVEIEHETVIKIPSDGKLNEQTYLQIAQFIEKQQKDVFIYVTKDSKYTNRFNQEENRKQVKEINVNKDLEDSFHLKKSSLPFKHAVQLAFSSLLTKKIRLIFITLLFTLSLAFVGVAASISLYNVSVSSAKTFSNANITYLPIQKQQYTCFKEIQNTRCTDTPVNVTDEDLNLLQEQYPNLKFAKSYDTEIQIPIEPQSYPYFTNTINRIIILDQNEEMFNLRFGDFPENDNEILITDYLAHMIVEFGNVDGVVELEDVIGFTIPIREDYKVVGIVETDYEKFNHLIRETDYQPFEESNYLSSTIYYLNIYMRKEVYDHKFYQLTFDQSKSTIPWVPTGLQYDTGWFKSYANASLIPTHPSYEQYLIGDSRLPENSNEMVLPASTFAKLYDADQDADLAEEYKRLIGIIGDEFEISIRLPIRTIEHGVRVNRSGKIVGIYDDSKMPPIREKEVGQHWPYWISTKDELEIIDKIQLNINSRAIVLLDENDRENLKFIKAFDELDYKHQNEFSEALYQVESKTHDIQRVFYIIGIFLSIFTSFLIFAFISASIKNKQKHIGTLRAIGARGFDVSKIFIIEGLMIASIAAILGTIGMAIGISKINELLTFGFNIELILLYINWIHIFIVFGLAIIMVLFATFIPVKRITLMKPINAIKRVN